MIRAFTGKSFGDWISGRDSSELRTVLWSDHGTGYRVTAHWCSDGEVHDLAVEHRRRGLWAEVPQWMVTTRRAVLDLAIDELFEEEDEVTADAIDAMAAALVHERL